MHSVSMADPDCFTSPSTFSKFSVFILPDLMRASKNALWAECTFSRSNSNSKDWALVNGFDLSIGSLMNMNSLRMWSMMRRCV